MINEKNSTLLLIQVHNVSTQDRIEKIHALCMDALIFFMPCASMAATTSNKQQSPSTRKMNHCLFCKWTTLSVLKTELQMSCFLHECPWSYISMPKMSMLTQVRWVAIFVESQWIFGTLECASCHWKALISTCWSKWYQWISSQPDSPKIKMSVENSRADLLIHNKW